MKTIIFILLSISFLLNLSASSLFSALENKEVNFNKALLGKKLFYEKRLSKDNTISCASCHDLDKGGADDKKVSLGVNNKKGLINSPSVFNSVNNFRQFWDGSVHTLEEQVSGPITNKNEMSSSFDEIIKKLSKDKSYIRSFYHIYKEKITKENIINAIVEFEKSLITKDSKFDLFLKGKKDALSKNELEGLDFFKNRGCVSCHNGVNIGGNMFQKIGTLKEYKSGNLGRYNITKEEDDKYVFKVPSLRNIDLTSPYLHSGEIDSLEETVELMYLHQLGLEVNKNEIKRIVVFLKTLTGKKPEIMSLYE